MLVNYVRTDSLNRNYIDTDTLSFNFRKPKEVKSKDNKKEDTQYLHITSNIQSTHEIYQPIRIELEQPVIQFDTAHIKLLRMVDSSYVASPYSIERTRSIRENNVLRTSMGARRTVSFRDRFSSLHKLLRIVE